nr:uncharacterized protein LOC111419530 [Onthophagus taurus]
MPKCSVLGCKNHSFSTKGRNIHYFKFPSEPGVCNRWIDFCGQTVNLKSGSICSMHFKESDFTISYKVRKELGFRCAQNQYLHENTIPTQLSPLTTTKQNNNVEKAREVVCTTSTIPPLITPTTLAEDVPFTPEVSDIVKTEFKIEETNNDSTPCQKSTTSRLLSTKTGDDDVVKLKLEISILNKKIKSQNMEIEHLNKILQKCFTPGQIKCLKRGKQSTNISSRSTTPKTYQVMSYIKLCDLNEKISINKVKRKNKIKKLL